MSLKPWQWNTNLDTVREEAGAFRRSSKWKALRRGSAMCDQGGQWGWQGVRGGERAIAGDSEEAIRPAGSRRTLKVIAEP